MELHCVVAVSRNSRALLDTQQSFWHLAATARVVQRLACRNQLLDDCLLVGHALQGAAAVIHRLALSQAVSGSGRWFADQVMKSTESL